MTKRKHNIVVTAETYEGGEVVSGEAEPLIGPVESGKPFALGEIEPVEQDPRFEPPADERARASLPDGYPPPLSKHDNPCFLNAADDEPIFVLRAHDALAVPAVLYWIDLAASVGVPEAKLDRAREDVKRMEAWAAVHGCKRPD